MLLTISTLVPFFNSVAKNPKASPPLYLTKKDYGSNPVYNLKRQEHVRHQREEIEKNADQVALEQHAAELQEQGIVEMPEEERLKILAGLKQNWEKLNLGYQRLSLTVDTVPKITRKVTMEQQLKEYEELIARFSNTKIHVNFNPLFQ